LASNLKVVKIDSIPSLNKFDKSRFYKQKITNDFSMNIQEQSSRGLSAAQCNSLVPGGVIFSTTPTDVSERATSSTTSTLEHEADPTARIKRMYEHGVFLGHSPSMVNLGTMLATNINRQPEDDVSAVQLFRQATDLKSPYGMVGLGLMYESGRGGLPKDDSYAKDLYLRAATLGNSIAMVYLGSFYARHDNDVYAAQYFSQGVALENPDAMVELGIFFAQGRGRLLKNDEKAVQLFLRAAIDHRSPEAMCNLGSMYEQGRGGLPADDRQAAAWYDQAAALGNPGAMSNLGIFYAYGRGGLQQNYARAAQLFKEAARLGNRAALINFEIMIKENQSCAVFEQDFVEAVALNSLIG
jgi:TPR repeat protein